MVGLTEARTPAEFPSLTVGFFSHASCMAPWMSDCSSVHLSVRASAGPIATH